MHKSPSQSSGPRRCARYFAIVVGALLALETCCRVERDTLFESTHRALFKLAMYRKHGRADVAFFGTSRTGEALRPHAFLSAAPPGISTAFNCSVQYSSLDILSEVIDRVAAGGLAPKLAIIEVSHHQLVRAPVPWLDKHAPAVDFEGDAADWIAAHSELMRLRKAFVLDSLARYAGVALFSRWFDGSEQFGVDYAAALIGRRRALSDEPPLQLASVPHAAKDSDDDALAVYKRIVKALPQTRVIFYAPPHQGGDVPPDYIQRVLDGVALLGPLYDFSATQLPDDHFRDPTHMSHKGGLRFSRDFARLLHAVQ